MRISDWSSDVCSSDLKTYCLDSCRHQFVANMKELMTPAEVSAMVGHNITITAIENYGRRKSAWGPEDMTERPSAIPEEVSLVRQRIEFFDEAMRSRAAAGLPLPDLEADENGDIRYGRASCRERVWPYG